MTKLRHRQAACSGTFAVNQLDSRPRAPFSILSRPLMLRGSMNKNPTNQLWSPQNGIRFSPKPKEQALYPALDMSRYFHESTETKDANGLSKAGENPPEQKKTAAFSEQQHINDFVSSSNVDQNTALMDKEENNAAEKAHDLQFHMSDRLFHLARVCEPGSPASFWSHTMYERLNDDGALEKVKVHYCTSKHTMEQVCQKYFLNEPVLGFDLEWMAYAPRSAGPRETVSLIQVASPSRIGLFHIALFKKDDFIGPIFRSIMENPEVSKVGVNIAGDCTRMKNKLGVTTRGIFELGHLYKVVKYLPEGKRHLINKVPVALATLVKEVLRLPMYKGPSVRESNWMRALNEKQITYSASDAYAGIQLYHVLEDRRRRLDPCPDRPFHLELNLPIPLPDLATSSDGDFLALSDDELAADAGLDTSVKPITPQRPPKRPKANSLSAPDDRDSRIIAADDLAIGYRADKTNKDVRTPRAALRSYYMWYHNEDLAPDEMAELLRDPPLKLNTVTGYILDSILAEELPYDPARLRDEVLSLLDDGVADGPKYAKLLAACQQGDEQ